MLFFFLLFQSKSIDITQNFDKAGNFVMSNTVFGKLDGGVMTVRPFRFMQKENEHVKLIIKSCSFISIHFEGSAEQNNYNGAVFFVTDGINSTVTMEKSCIYDCRTMHSGSVGGAFHFRGNTEPPIISYTTISYCCSPKRVIYLESTNFGEFESEQSNYS